MIGTSWKDEASIYNITIYGQMVLKNISWKEVEKFCRHHIRKGGQPHNIRILQTVHERVPQFIIDRMKERKRK